MNTVLITGANRGLGLEFTKQYLKNGWAVIATCRNPQNSEELLDLKEKYSNNLEVYPLNVADFEEVEKLADELSGTSIDVLLNNAGVYGGNENKFGSINYDNWADTLLVNTMAPLNIAECFVDHVAGSEQKKMIFITSKMGSIADNTSGGSYIYRSSKSALNSIVRSLSHDLKDQGITCTLFHPGWVQTDMGGPNALITAEESITNMRGVIASLDLNNSGQYLNYDGKEIGW